MSLNIDFVQSCKHAFDDAKRSILTPYHTAISTWKPAYSKHSSVCGRPRPQHIMPTSRKIEHKPQGTDELEPQLLNFGAFQAAGPPSRAPAALGEPTEARDGGQCLLQLAALEQKTAAMCWRLQIFSDLPLPGFCRGRSSFRWWHHLHRHEAKTNQKNQLSDSFRLGRWSRPSRPRRPGWCQWRCWRAKCLLSAASRAHVAADRWTLTRKPSDVVPVQHCHGLGDPVRDLDKLSQIGHSSEAQTHALRCRNRFSECPPGRCGGYHDVLKLIDSACLR